MLRFADVNALVNVNCEDLICICHAVAVLMLEGGSRTDDGFERHYECLQLSWN